MNDQQWNDLVAIIRGETLPSLPTGFIIDSPWLPNWAGGTTLDYFTNERFFFDANLKAIRTFPQTMFLPGFWSEYGMCTEPSAFGAVSIWEEDQFPFAKKVLRSAADVEFLEKPNARKDGLLPFVIKRLQHLQPEIEKEGHKIRFAVARGPLNIASFLMGATEFLLAIKTDPELMHRLLTITTDFLVDWIAYQRESFPSIDGILLLDDIVGFVGQQRLRSFRPSLFKKSVQRGCDREVFPQRRAVQGLRAFPAGDRHQSSELRDSAHAVGNEGMDRKQGDVDGKYSAA